MKAKLNIPKDFDMESLSEDRQAIYIAIKVLQAHNEGVGCASAEVMKSTAESIESGEFNSWLALEFQANPIVLKASTLIEA